VREMAKVSVHELTRTAAELVENAVILEPRMPIDLLAARILSEADETFMTELGRFLAVPFFARLIRAERAKQSKSAQMRLPGFEQLPVRILGDRDRRVILREATYADVRRYYWSLGKRQSERRKTNPKMLQLKTLLDRMKEHAKTNRGITVAEVLGLDF
jgi:hypothetical protein